MRRKRKKPDSTDKRPSYQAPRKRPSSLEGDILKYIAAALVLVALVGGATIVCSSLSGGRSRPRSIATTRPTTRPGEVTLSPSPRSSPTVVAISPTQNPTLLIPSPSSPLPDIPALQNIMLQHINQDRLEAGLSPVEWDAIAAEAGMAHAQEMAEHGYFSHWNLSGHGPDYRYTQAGGLDTVVENIYNYWYGYDNSRPAPISDWEKVVTEAQESLMQSPIHRKNILDPYHTHVGVGMAYNQASGEVKITQEFVNRYVSIQPLPRKAFLGVQVILQGRLLASVTEPVVSMAFEPFPEPVTTAELDATGTFASPAEIYQVVNPEVQDSHFTARLIFDHDGQPGLYHVGVWVKVNAQEVLASEIVVEVR